SFARSSSSGRGDASRARGAQPLPSSSPAVGDGRADHRRIDSCLGVGTEVTDMSLAHEAAVAIGKALRPVHAGPKKLAACKLGGTVARPLEVTSPAMSEGQLPRSATKDGAGTPPTLQWSGTPAQARSIAVVCEDPDAPLPEPFVNWLVYCIPATQSSLD